VRIEGYKSIAYCDVALQPLAILVGRNSSGKSNFLDALAFLRDAFVRGTDEAVRLHGGRRAVLPRSTRAITISFRITADFESDFLTAVELDHFTADYDVKIKLSSRSKPAVQSERVRIAAVGDGKVSGFDRKATRVRWTGLSEDSSPGLNEWWSDDQLIIGHFPHSPFKELGDGLRAMGFYNFSPEVMRRHQSPSYGALLERDGRNLASVLKEIKKRGGETWSRLRDYLSSITEEIEGFKIVDYGEFETIRFFLRPGGDKRFELDASSMSDGTLRALATLAAVFQSNGLGIPSVVGIEEPETALHPAAMRALVDALDEATERTQILLTTHSADLLDDRSLDASQVLIVRYRDGQTQITPVDAASREILRKELYSLAELQRQDLLNVDQADLRRQAAERSGGGGT
jgi:predicted ATPase